MFCDENQLPAVAPLSRAFERDRFVLCADGLVSERHRVWDNEGRQILLADSARASPAWPLQFSWRSPRSLWSPCAW